MQVNTPLWKTLHGVTPATEAIYQIFLNGKLVFKPEQNSEEGKIEQLFSNLAHPFNVVFDLSECDNDYQHLKITTSPRSFFEIEERDNQLNILIAPHFLIDKLISTTAKPFKCIMNYWYKDRAPFGIFLRMGDWEESSTFLYITTNSIACLTNNCLQKHIWNAMCTDAWSKNGVISDACIGWRTTSRISCLFCEPK